MTHKSSYFKYFIHETERTLHVIDCYPWLKYMVQLRCFFGFITLVSETGQDFYFDFQEKCGGQK